MTTPNTEARRIFTLIRAFTDLVAKQYAGLLSIVSDDGYRLGWFAAGAWRFCAMRGAAEAFLSVVVTQGIIQWLVERIQSVQYVKIGTTTVTGITVEKSLITGNLAAQGFTGIAIPAGRLNISALLTDLKLKGAISSSGNAAVVWKVYVNGVVKATQNLSRNWGATNWRIEGNGTTRSTGAAGTRQWDLGLYANADNANAATSYYDLSWFSTLDLTAAVTLDVTVQPANSSTTITCTTGYLKHS